MSKEKNYMADSCQVKCINKSDRTNHYERITHIGGFDNKAWRIAEPEAIAGIEAGKWAFYTLVNSKRAEVVIANHFGRKYLKTTADGDHPNNLLSLPECPR